MVDKLRLNVIFDDFSKKVSLTEEQQRILKMLMNKDKIVKISLSIGMSERTTSEEIKRLKVLFNNYRKLEKTKLEILFN